MAFSCKTLKLNRPIHGIDLSYFGPPPVHPEQLEVAQKEGFAAGEAAASERHNAQILEYRNELQTLHDDVLGSIDQRFQELCAGISAMLPDLVVEVARKALPTARFEVDEVKLLIDQLVAENGGEERVLSVKVGERDFDLLNKMMDPEGTSSELSHGGIRVERDLNLGTGDCILNTEYGLVDASVGTRIKHIRAALEGEKVSDD